jgi:hypothetical protein
VDQIEPDKKADEGDDDGLIEEGQENHRVEADDPLWLKNEADQQENGDRENELIKKRMDGLNLPCHESFYVERCRPPEERSQQLQQVAEKHGWFCCRGLPSENDENPREGEDETGRLYECQRITLQEEMGANGNNKGTRIDEEDRACCIRIEETDVNTSELQTKQEAHHEAMK